MTAILEKPAASATPATPSSELDHAQLRTYVAQACQRIAPTWPLDQFIAVNPYWGFVDQPIAQAAQQLGLLAGTPLVMPRSYYSAQYAAGQLTQEQFGMTTTLSTCITTNGSSCMTFV